MSAPSAIPPDAPLTVSSRYPVVFRARCRLSPHHPVMRPLAQLATTPRRSARLPPSVLTHCSSFSTALTFVLAPLPNALFSHCGSDDFAASYEGGGPIDLGRFITSMFVVTGFALPIVLAHSDVITTGACVMSIIGGGYVSICYTAPPVQHKLTT